MGWGKKKRREEKRREEKRREEVMTGKKSREERTREEKTRENKRRHEMRREKLCLLYISIHFYHCQISSFSPIYNTFSLPYYFLTLDCILFIHLLLHSLTALQPSVLLLEDLDSLAPSNSRSNSSSSDDLEYSIIKVKDNLF